MPDDLDMPPGEALQEAQKLLDADRPFHAHEVLEAVWKAAPSRDRPLWRGLAQLAVGLTHDQRGNPAGTGALLERGAASLIEWCAQDRPGADDVRRIAERAREAAATQEAQPSEAGRPSARSSSPSPSFSAEFAAIMSSLASSISASASGS
jgi:predicted metal-dependent hydrolase